MSAKSRTKGAVAEREVCKLLRDEFGENVVRKLDQTRDGGNDIDFAPFRIEVKRRKALALEGQLKQVEKACAGTSEVPVVFTRADNGKWIVCMRFDEWARLAREEVAYLGEAGITVRAGLTD
jgi:Holliday junction resolvase